VNVGDNPKQVIPGSGLLAFQICGRRVNDGERKRLIPEQSVRLAGTSFELASVLVRLDHVASVIVNANLQRLCSRIQNADMTRTIWQDY